MTVKEQLRQTIDELSEAEAEAEAAETLDYLARRREPREQIARGEVFSAEQIKRAIA